MRLLPDTERLPSEALSEMLKQLDLGLAGARNYTFDYSEEEGSGKHHRLQLSLNKTGNPVMPLASEVLYYQAPSVFEDMQELVLPSRELDRVCKVLLEAKRPLVKGIIWRVSSDNLMEQRLTRLVIDGMFEALEQIYRFEYRRELSFDEIADLQPSSPQLLAEHFLKLYWTEHLQHMHHFTGSLVASHVRVVGREMLPILFEATSAATSVRTSASSQFLNRVDRSILLDIKPVVARKKRKRIIKI